MKNPFIISQPITDPKDFYDREKELKEVFSEIKNQSNISLIGERKIGKTSLLNMVCHPDKMREYGIDTKVRHANSLRRNIQMLYDLVFLIVGKRDESPGSSDCV